MVAGGKVAAIVAFFVSAGHSFMHYTGTNNSAGHWYGFWSGWGSVFIQPAMIVGILLYLRHTNCEVHRCPRRRWREWENPKDGRKHFVCRYHHPDGQHKLHERHMPHMQNQMRKA